MKSSLTLHHLDLLSCLRHVEWQEWWRTKKLLPGSKIIGAKSAPHNRLPLKKLKMKAATTKKALPKAKWMWHGDDGWHAYDEKLSDKIEKAFQDEKDEYKVDDERFVDLKKFLQR
jgi:hypothetical protein